MKIENEKLERFDKTIQDAVYRLKMLKHGLAGTKPEVLRTELDHVIHTLSVEWPEIYNLVEVQTKEIMRYYYRRYREEYQAVNIKEAMIYKELYYDFKDYYEKGLKL